MEVVYGDCNKSGNLRCTGVGLGNFDGLHIGHMTLINTLIEECKLNDLDSVIYTFTKHPENILRKKLFTPLLTTANKKIELLDRTSLKFLCFDEFDERFSRMKPENFVKDILVDRFNIKLAVAGYNYRFGYRGQGDESLLKELGKKYGFKVVVIPPIKVDDEIVNSTLIRHNVSKGNLDKVFKLLGRHFSISGMVQSGKRLGNTLGFATANIYPQNYLALPQNGVYITKTLLNNTLFNSITNIGVKPTFEEQGSISIETHILDFDQDIYDKNIEVFFISKIRGEKKFKGKNELIDQIRQDIYKTREFFRTDEK